VDRDLHGRLPDPGPAAPRSRLAMETCRMEIGPMEIGPMEIGPMEIGR
jgi:hypothetical protein